MRTASVIFLTVLSAMAATATFLDEVLLQDLAEREGYQMTLHELERMRREVTDSEEKCRCPPGPPPPDFEDLPPPRPPRGDPEDSSGEGMRPFPPPPPPGCFPPPFHHRGRPDGPRGPPCELRPMFQAPEKFNFTARAACFDKWERPTATQFGVTPEARRDMGRFRPWQRHALLWNKGCDMQCLFSEMGLLGNDGPDAEPEELTVDPDAVIKILSEEGDSSDISMAIEKAVKSCMDSSTELVHTRQVCRSGADEILFCLQRTLEATCPGAKWKEQRSCDEVADATSKLRSCQRRHRMHPPPPPPPPPPQSRRAYWRQQQKQKPSSAPDQELQNNESTAAEN